MLAVLLSVLGPALFHFPSAPQVHTAEARAATALYRDLNRERSSYGIPPLSLDGRLGTAAVSHVLDMIRNRYFSHETPSGETPFDRFTAAGCIYRFAGENIAMAPDEQLADWAIFGSAPHRRNILNPHYARVGIAAAYDARGQLFFVEDFSD